MDSNDVSIVIPTYNRSKFLFQVLKSYISQKNVKEIIIIDDGSSDDYTECVDYYSKLNDVDLIYHKLNKNKGQAYCRNYGIKIASGKYIMMGEDDVFLEDNYVEVLRNKIFKAKQKNQNIFICGNIFYDVPFELNKEELKKLKHKIQKKKNELFDYKNFFGSFEQFVDKDTNIPFGHALIMVDKVAYKGVKYYEKYKANSFREESDGQVQITKCGYNGYITSDTCCYHIPGIFTHNALPGIDWVKFHINFMKANRVFWNRNYEFFKKKYNYSYPKFLPVISHDWRDFKMIVKGLIFNKVSR